MLIRSKSISWKGLSVPTAVLLVLAMLLPIRANADAVSDWSFIANTVVIMNAGTRPPASMIDFAYVHIAIYDAVNAIDGRYSVFSVAPSTATAGASPEAATAAAAYTMLVAFYPAQKPFLDTTYSNYLGNLPAGIARDRGVAVGTDVAKLFLAARQGDGRNANVPYVFGSGPGVYQATPGAPPSPITPLFPWIAQMKPFTLHSPSQFRADGRPNLTSAQWAEDFNEVKALGALKSSLRTDEQTAIGWFYVENPGIQVNRNIRGIAAANVLSIADSARFFAQTWVSIADSLIACWDSKYYYNFWRPVTAIRNADSDGNPATESDVSWSPLAVTPAHQEYPAAHGCVTAALAHSLEDFFKDQQLNVILTSTSVPGMPLTARTFARPHDMISEVIDARVYSGFHYRTSGVHGAVIGKKVAHWVSKNYFLPAK
jgi:PAP2 superfamily